MAVGFPRSGGVTRALSLYHSTGQCFTTAGKVVSISFTKQKGTVEGEHFRWNDLKPDFPPGDQKTIASIRLF